MRALFYARGESYRNPFFPKGVCMGARAVGIAF